MTVFVQSMIHNNYVASGVLRLDNGFEEELQIADRLWVGISVQVCLLQAVANSR